MPDIKLLSGVLKLLTALFDVLTGAFHGVTAGSENRAEKKCTENTDLELFFHTLTSSARQMP